ncbi:hypothetical protein G3480_08605 [Thiorhodococcus mannitoliphagus]|uniref:Uncharacterized protein n=1 Tax=Thiorhodococcus mannitoliphagus TaxID=329406 RepID=A0A6P1DUJ7_9GAMM|nr:hypothetical protein [Thiorhodococcus mannitoliphagus]NEX20366.1 hypothetical protein [Thiorhodococcus mannitoliphagus]
MSDSNGKTLKAERSAHPRAQTHALRPRLTAWPAIIALGIASASLLGVARAESTDDPGAPLQDDWMGAAETASPWLDEVRAQRHAWELRRKAAREEFEARRRRNNPRASARQEAWEEGLRQRRAERQERIEQERELFRSLGPTPPTHSTPPPPSDPGNDSPSPPQPDPMLKPPGWNNLWYFRGF